MEKEFNIDWDIVVRIGFILIILSCLFIPISCGVSVNNSLTEAEIADGDGAAGWLIGIFGTIGMVLLWLGAFWGIRGLISVGNWIITGDLEYPACLMIDAVEDLLDNIFNRW